MTITGTKSLNRKETSTVREQLEVIKEILAQLKIFNAHQEIITDEVIKKEDIDD